MLFAISVKQEVKKIATNYIDLYPTFAKLYFYAGLANYKLKKSKEAIDQLETGLEFIVEDLPLENQFYLLLSETYKQNNNTTKEKMYRSKSELIRADNIIFYQELLHVQQQILYLCQKIKIKL